MSYSKAKWKRFNEVAMIEGQELIITQEQIRTAIVAQDCPWCGKGGWHNLALHTWYKHGISANALREMAFWYKSVPTCSSGLSVVLRSKAIRGNYSLRMIGKNNLNPKRQMSAAGKRQRLIMILATREKAAKTLSYTRKRLFAEGKLRNPNPCKPHTCPVCGVVIPKAEPIACSIQCRHILLHNAQAKAMQKRKIKVPRSEYPKIAERVKQGEKPRKIAVEYGVSRRMISLIYCSVMRL